MSLINDALKQARQSQQPGQPDGQPPLRPVEPDGKRVPNWILPLAVVALAGASVFFIALALTRHKSSPAPAAKAPEIPVAQTAVSQQPAAAQTAVAPAVAPVPTAVAIVTNAPTLKKTAATAPPSTSGIKLQGIIHGQKSWAIVNGKTVYVGDSVGGFRVQEISPDSITLESPDGSRQKLGLGQ